MSQSNPYAPPSDSIQYMNWTPPTVSIDPISLLKRSYAMLGDQYFLFVGITAVGILIGSMVPFGILLGPMMVGIYLCYIDREQGKKVEFGTLFKGFDQFANALIAVLMMLGITLIAVIPVLIVMVIGLVATRDSGLSILVFLFCYLLLFLVCLMASIPFLFVFQLIADKGMTGPQALRLSFRAVKANLMGVIGLVFVSGVLSLLAAAACYIPVFFLMPISLGAMYLAYRDIFGTSFAS
jgi:uncharacterized membrane protein